MTKVNRRSSLRATTVAPFAVAGSLTPGFGLPLLSSTDSGQAAPSGQTSQGVTRTLARYVVNAKYEEIPAKVRKEGLRTLLNWVGVAVGGSRHQTVEAAVAALAPISGPGQACLLGRRERFDILNATFVNGVSSHVFDFDDTHLKTIVHAGSGDSGHLGVERGAHRLREGVFERFGTGRRDGVPHRQRCLPRSL
jgi:hypothetical protein